jgi:hypothetical protein
MTAVKRGMLVGMACAVASLAVLTGCTTGCDGGSFAAAEMVLATPPESTSAGPGPELLSVWKRLLKAVRG